MPRKQKKHHFIYLTTNVLTGRFYVGMHSTDNLEDGYMGSGQILWRSIKKYGQGNHKVEIIEHLHSREELQKREKEIVNENLLLDPLCMNLKIGGNGGWDHLQKDDKYFAIRSRNGKIFGSVNGANALNKLTSEDRSDRAKEDWAKNRETKLEALLKFTSIAANSDAAKEKKRETWKSNKFQQGENNSQFGTCWIFNDSINKAIKIKKDDLPQWLTQGWKLGRK